MATSISQQFIVDGRGRLHERYVLESVARLKEMFPEVDPAALETQVMLERSHRLLANARQSQWAKFGLTGSRFILLRLLYASPEKRLTMSEIAADMNLGANGATQLVDAMSRAGLVKRETADNDKRMIYAALTARGEKLFSEVMPDTARRTKQAWAPLTEEELDLMRHLLAKVRMHLLTNETLLKEDHSSDEAKGRRQRSTPKRVSNTRKRIKQAPARSS
jgi:MarR family transcriptional regulator, 2-MHQ and catechol-resistance regulon repressor